MGQCFGMPLYGEPVLRTPHVGPGGTTMVRSYLVPASAPWDRVQVPLSRTHAVYYVHPIGISVSQLTKAAKGLKKSETFQKALKKGKSYAKKGKKKYGETKEKIKKERKKQQKKSKAKQDAKDRQCTRIIKDSPDSKEAKRCRKKRGNFL